MKRAFMIAAAAALVVASIGLAGAQGGQGRGGFGQGRGGGFGGLALLNIPEVQQELKMTQPQIDKVGPKVQEVRQARSELFQGGGGPPSPEALQKIQEMQDKAAADILDTKQLKRYHQLELQQAGANAFGRKAVADALKLTEDQKSKIQGIQQDTRQKQMELGQSLRGGGGQPSQEDFQQMMTKMQAIQKEASEKTMAVLTDAQKAQWKEMTGEPFKFPPPQFGRRPGGGGNPPPV